MHTGRRTGGDTENSPQPVSGEEAPLPPSHIFKALQIITSLTSGCPKRPVKSRQSYGSGLCIHAGLPTRLLPARLNPRKGLKSGNPAATISVAAQAGDLYPVPDALTVVAAIFLVFGGRAGAGRIRAFLGLIHNPPLSVH